MFGFFELGVPKKPKKSLISRLANPGDPYSQEKPGREDRSFVGDSYSGERKPDQSLIENDLRGGDGAVDVSKLGPDAPVPYTGIGDRSGYDVPNREGIEVAEKHPSGITPEQESARAEVLKFRELLQREDEILQAIASARVQNIDGNYGSLDVKEREARTQRERLLRVLAYYERIAEGVRMESSEEELPRLHAEPALLSERKDRWHGGESEDVDLHRVVPGEERKAA